MGVTNGTYIKMKFEVVSLLRWKHKVCKIYSEINIPYIIVCIVIYTRGSCL